ncbi:unnamed protein product [Dicrocoelium dendriticum]|nr:unnamed protein product [Dicrocoelium dendriticum]
METQTFIFSIPLGNTQEAGVCPGDVPTTSLSASDERTKQLLSKDDAPSQRNHEEIVKITRHRTESSDQNDDTENPVMQCCLCGELTLERCLLCKWAAYCSAQCYNLHRPIHQYFCVPHYGKIYPRLTGLNVISVTTAVERLETVNHSAPPSPIGRPETADRCSIDASRSPTLGLSGRLTELGLIHRRARIIRTNLRDAGGKPACAICGDTCEQEDKVACETPTKMEGDFDNLSHFEKCSSGDTTMKDKDTMPQRLVRFAGMLICTCCVEIQATDLCFEGI